MTQAKAVLWATLLTAVATGMVTAQTAEPVAETPFVAESAEELPAPVRLYGSVEYLYWWLREGHIPPLLTTSSFASGGLLGQADTRVLYGDDRLETRHGDRFIGARPQLGWWLDDAHSLAVEGSAFFLERDSTYFKAVSDGSTLLARPYISALDGSPASEIIAGPNPAGLRNGGFNGYSRIEFFGEEANLIGNVLEGAADRLDVVAGARFLQLRDRLDLTATGRLLPDQTTLYGLTDHFRVANAFYGGQVGLRSHHQWGHWDLDFRGTAALGGNVETIRTFGDRTTQTPLQREVLPYGLAVLPSNAGRFQRTAVDALYEFGVNVGYRLGEHVRIFCGYTFLLWDSPLRAGDQVDLYFNPNQLAGAAGGPARPAIPWRDDLFWAQGLSVGLEFRW
jgi:hypothetical protein